jgi:hypothetical protein
MSGLVAAMAIGRNDCADVRLEDVRAHARHVADIVAHVIGDGRRVTRVVFRYPGLDLADEVCAHVRRLRVDAAADAREERNRTCSHRKAGDDLGERPPARFVGTAPDARNQNAEDEADTEQTQTRDAQTHHCAAVESDPQSHSLPDTARRLARADVGARRRFHPGQPGEDRTEPAADVGEGREEADSPVEHGRDDEQERDDNRILALEKRHRPGVNLFGDALHDGVAIRRAPHRKVGERGEDESGDSGPECEIGDVGDG